MSKKAKIIWLIIGAIGLIIVMFLIIVNPVSLVNRIRLATMGYSGDAISQILESELADEALELGYNQTLDVVAKDADFDPANFAEYTEVEFTNQAENQANFVQNVNNLLEMDYSPSAINAINKTATDADISEILTIDTVEDIEDYLQFDYARAGNVTRYVPYKLYCGCEYEDVVTWVNIGLDQDFYENTVEISDFNETMLVNKYRSLPKDYAPELATIDSAYAVDGEQKATPETVTAFLEMAKDMEKEGLYILANSTYRDYEGQEEIFEMYAKDYGEAGAKQFAALPGFSEHQTGYSVDIASKGHEVFDDTAEQKWLENNAYKYGFILRYPKDKQGITGYANESWHFRYLGPELAQKVKDSGLTFDEYYIRFLDK